jgi:hypothetical protein
MLAETSAKPAVAAMRRHLGVVGKNRVRTQNHHAKAQPNNAKKLGVHKIAHSKRLMDLVESYTHRELKDTKTKRI